MKREVAVLVSQESQYQALLTILSQGSYSPCEIDSMGDVSKYMNGRDIGNEFSKAHHQQYIDWKQSKHFREGVTCTSFHYVHQVGVPPTRSQTHGAGSKQCFECHVQVNQNMAHSIHSFANCVGCHMPRIVTSAESGGLHSHVFATLLPKVTLKDKSMPNSC